MAKLLTQLIISIVFSHFAIGQITIKGNIKDEANSENLAGISIIVKGKQIGTVSDRKGNFQFTTFQAFPITLSISSIGYSSQEKVIETSANSLDIRLKEQAILAQEVVVSSTRLEESALKSSSTIEVLTAKNIRESTSTNFYDEIRNLKGVDFTTNSVFFSSVNIRGSNSTGNTKVLQLIDGMDNQAPGLNFAIGNLVGISELDLDRLEVAVGPSSALYGSAAFNGTILMNSKNPFQHQGLSVLLKNGAMNAENRIKSDGSALGSTPLLDYSVRYAKAINDKLAFKVNFSYQKAQDWQANDATDVSYRNNYNYLTGNALNNPAYNGLNFYGDEIRANLTNLRPALTQLLGLPANALPASIAPLVTGINQVSQLTKIPTSTIVNELLPSVGVARTGINERDLADYNAQSLKLNAALHYRINEKAELILQGSYGKGTTVYTGSDRYFIKNFSMGQYKLELKSNNYFLRAYTNQERSGDSYAIGIQSQYFNEAWKKSFDETSLQTLSESWFPQYGLSFAGGALQTFSTTYQTALKAGQTSEQAYQTAISAKNTASYDLHLASRAFADKGKPVYGSEEFNKIGDKIAKTPIPNGAKFLDKTNLYHFEGMYNFKEFKWANVLIGSSYRIYQLRSEGTIFAKNPENNQEYNIHEVGVYAQGIKTFLDEKIKITTGIRYDKNFRLPGLVTPRIGLFMSPNNHHNFRISYQTGFRLPTAQEQYLDLVVPGQHNLGGVKAVIEKYDLIGKAIEEVSYNAGKPVVYEYGKFLPEKVQTLDIGYKLLVSNFLLMDFNYYHSIFPNKMSSINLVKVNADKSTEIFNVAQAFAEKITAQGIAIGGDLLLPARFSMSANYSMNVSSTKLFNNPKFALTDASGAILEEIPPRNRWNFAVKNANLFKTGISFNVSYRHQSPATNNTPLLPGIAKGSAIQMYIPIISLVDAQISKKVKSLKSIIKIGGTNLGGNLYRTTLGNPFIGSTYYISVLFDELLN